MSVRFIQLLPESGRTALHHSRSFVGIAARPQQMDSHAPLADIRRLHHYRVMKLKAYFAGERLRLHSQFPADIAAQRIRDAAGSLLWPFASGVVGGVWSGRLRLRYRSSIFEYNAKPVLAGRLINGPRGSILDLRYRAPIWVYFFEAIWYACLCSVAALMLINGLPPGAYTGDKIMVLTTLAVLFVAPLVLHVIGTRNSAKELAKIVDFLSIHAGTAH